MVHARDLYEAALALGAAVAGSGFGEGDAATVAVGSICVARTVSPKMVGTRINVNAV